MVRPSVPPTTDSYQDGKLWKYWQSKGWARFHEFLQMEGQGVQDKFSMLVTVTDLLTCYSMMTFVIHLEFSSLVTLWKSSFKLVRLPHILLNLKQHPSMHQKLKQKLEIYFYISKLNGTVQKKLSNNSTKHSILKEQLQGCLLTKPGHP